MDCSSSSGSKDTPVAGESSNARNVAVDRFKKHEQVQLLDKDRQVFREIKILNGVQKNVGKSKSYYKFRFEDSKDEGVADFNIAAWRAKPQSTQVGHQCLLVDDEHHEVFAITIPHQQHHRPEIKEAKVKELEKVKSFGTFLEVEEKKVNKNNIILSTWAVVFKGTPQDGFYKARLCARGDLEKDSFRTDSPTAKKNSIRLLLTIAASKGWKIKTIDYANAFCQGEALDREVYFRPPLDFAKKNPGIVWKLLKPLYG